MCWKPSSSGDVFHSFLLLSLLLFLMHPYDSLFVLPPKAHTRTYAWHKEIKSVDNKTKTAVEAKRKPDQISCSSLLWLHDAWKTHKRRVKLPCIVKTNHIARKAFFFLIIHIWTVKNMQVCFGEKRDVFGIFSHCQHLMWTTVFLNSKSLTSENIRVRIYYKRQSRNETGELRKMEDVCKMSSTLTYYYLEYS